VPYGPAEGERGAPTAGEEEVLGLLEEEEEEVGVVLSAMGVSMGTSSAVGACSGVDGGVDGGVGVDVGRAERWCVPWYQG